MAFGLEHNQLGPLTWIVDKRMDCEECRSHLSETSMVGKCMVCSLGGQFFNYRIGLEIHAGYLCPNHRTYAEAGALTGDLA